MAMSSAELNAQIAESATTTAKFSLLIGLVLCGVGAWFGGWQLQVNQPWDQMQESITLPDGTTSAIGAAPALVGLPIAVCSLVILQAGGESSTAVAIAAHVAVLVSTVGLLAACGFAAASHSAGNSSELPDCFLMGGLCAAHVWFNVLHFVDSGKLKRAAKAQ
jgi:hypothetical protein